MILLTTQPTLNRTGGFTLIELLLYLAISSLLLLTSVLFLWTLLESKEKNQTISEVETQGQQVLAHITQAIRNAEAVTAPGVGASASSLTLDVVNSGDDPTVFALAGGSVTVTEGGGTAVPLTNDLITVTDLTFTNLSRADTPGTIQITFTVSYESNSVRNQYDYSKTFYGTASLR